MAQVQNLDHDPLDGSKLDYFNKFHLEYIIRSGQRFLKKCLVKEEGESVICDLSLGSRIDDPEQDMEEVMDDLLDHVEDERFIPDTYDVDNAQNWIQRACTVSQQVYITPHLVEHFDFRGISCQHLLTQKVQYLCA